MLIISFFGVKQNLQYCSFGRTELTLTYPHETGPALIVGGSIGFDAQTGFDCRLGRQPCCRGHRQVAGGLGCRSSTGWL